MKFGNFISFILCILVTLVYVFIAGGIVILLAPDPNYLLKIPIRIIFFISAVWVARQAFKYFQKKRNS